VFIKDGSRNTFTDCRFSDNRAPGPGGIYGGAIAHFRDASGDNLLELTRCMFTGNRAVQSGPGGEPGGGAVYARTRVVAWTCDFVSNAVGYAHGGAVYIPPSGQGGFSYDHVFANCAFVANSVANAANSGGGGALYLGAAATAAATTVENCTFYSNRVAASTDHGGGAININGTLHAVTVRNSIFRNNPGFGGTREISRQSGTLALSYTSIDQTRIVAGFTAGAGMINVDPLFASESAPFDLHLKSKGGRWNPVSSQWVMDGVHSPCIDAGDTSPYANEPALNGGRINLGRYGNTAQASKSYVAIAGILGLNGAVVANNAAASVLAGTDYGTVIVGAPVAHTFSITNSGNATLNLTGTPAIAISGATAVFASNGTAVATSIAPGEASTFTVEFDPILTQTYNAVVSIANNDVTATPYLVNLTGFGQIQYTLSYTAGANGTLSGNANQVVNEGANGTAVMAVPNVGFKFTTWSDASTANPRTDLNVSGNIAVTANFVYAGTVLRFQ
jgi:hypothetical protein